MNNPHHNLASIGLVLFDIILYLDTHPHDQAALNAYHTYKNMYEEAVINYERQFGPLTAGNNSNENYFEWVNSPWPWEGGMC